jgi:3-isopropylmalate/(R)-2-methylmalate dehydratase small subunit
MMKIMDSKSVVTGKAIPIARDDVDTDQIIPAQFLRLLTKKGLGKYLFYRWRYDEDGTPRVGFVLDDPKFKGASIILAGRNFGVGSSRENAVWSLMDYGIKCVIAPSFGDIFYNNAAKNYLVCVKLPADVISMLQRRAEDGALVLKVDLSGQVMSSDDGFSAKFEMESAVIKKLTERKDDLEITQEWKEEISKFEERRKSFMNKNSGKTLFETQDPRT